MQKPFNAEGLDLTFLFDATYPDRSITEANNMTAASNDMPGFTSEQTASLQRMLSKSIGEALEPLLRPLSEFLSAWEKSPQSLLVNTSSTHSLSPDSGFETQSSTLGNSHDQLSSTELVKPSALESPSILKDCSTKNGFQPDRAYSSNDIETNLSAVPPSSVDRVPAKRKAIALGEAVTSLAKKNCTFGLVEKETSLVPDLQRYSTEVQVKEELTPEDTLLQNSQQYSAEDHASMFLSPAPSQSGTQPATLRRQATAETSADTDVEGQTYPASTGAGGLRPLDTTQPEAWLIFAESSAALKALFKDEPRMDKPCLTTDYLAEKPASLATPLNVYERSFPRLPFDAPFRCAHIIDVKKFFQNKRVPPIKTADIVVTFLFNYCPDVLYAFLNVTRHPEFTFTRIEAAGGGRRNFSIERSGLNVICSFHQPEHPEERKNIEEEQYDEEALIKQFGATRHEKTHFTCEMKPWGRWVTNSWSSGGVSRPAYNKDNKRTIERYAHAFGLFVFKSGMWMEGEGVTFEGGATSA